MSKPTRPVTVFEYYKPEGESYHEKRELGKGQFHEFGCDYEEFETGPGNYSTAIVELANGTIVNKPLDMIRFDDAEGSK